MTRTNRLCAVVTMGLALIASGASGGAARAQDGAKPAPSSDERGAAARTPDQERARAAVEKLRKAPDEDALRDVQKAGGAAFAPLAEALALEDSPAPWRRLSGALNEGVRDRFQDLETRILKIVRDLNEQGKSAPAIQPEMPTATASAAPEPASRTAIIELPEIMRALQTLESDVGQAGWAAAAELAREGAARDEISILARQHLLRAAYESMRADLTSDDAATREKAIARLTHLGPLAAPLLEAALASDDGKLKEAAGKARDLAVARYLKDLSADTQAARDFAADGLYGMGDLAKPALERIAASGPGGGTPDERYRADRLRKRIAWSISDDLYRKTGRLMDGFEKLSWRERRMLAYELEKQGGQDALPTLRRILERDPSENVQAIAAESLARLGDPEGLAFLAKMGAKPLVQSPEVLVAIALDQGDRYMRIKRYDKSIVEYDRVLEIQPKNDIALYNLACAYAQLGEKERALDYLKRSIDDGGFDDFDHMEKDEDLVSLHDDPRYQKMLEQGKLKKQTEQNPDQ